MARALVLCVEGETEQSFFGALLERHGFSSPKLQNIYLKDDVVVFIPPCAGMRTSCTGKDALRKKEKYEHVVVTINSHVSRLGMGLDDLHVAVCFDTETYRADYSGHHEQILAQVGKYCSSHGDVSVFPVSGTAENWFVAGLAGVIERVGNKKSFEQLTSNQSPDTLESVKNKFYSCFDTPEAVTLIARHVGNHFDIQMAQDLSPSFRDFHSLFEGYLS